MGRIGITKQSRKRLIFISGFLAFGLTIFYFSDLVYLGNQLVGQINILMSARPIDKLKQADYFTENQIQKLNEIDRIKSFAFDELKLKKVINYQSYVELNNNPVLWVITASEKYSLKPFEWNYPILGNLAYRGYFKKDKAEKAKQMLEEKDFEVCVGEVEAWSTLGFLPDPVLSSMLEKPVGDLARLIIHELTHASIFIADDADFNENFASFIGDEGAKRYIEKYYGKNSKEDLQLDTLLSNIQNFSAITLLYYDSLKYTYEKFKGALPLLVEQKHRLQKAYKKAIIDKLRPGKNRYKMIQDENWLPKNCFFNDIKMYRNFQSDFDKELKNDFQNQLDIMVEAYIIRYSAF